MNPLVVKDFGVIRNAVVILLALICGAPLCAEGKPDADPTAKRKVVVLGIDALDKRLMDQYMREGRLPNFEKLAQQGHYSPLRSSSPPMSPAAWSTMTTGLNPGRTGIFGFLKRKDGSYEPQLSLVHANEQPVLGGGGTGRWMFALMLALGAFCLSLIVGKVLAIPARTGRKTAQFTAAIGATVMALSIPIAFTSGQVGLAGGALVLVAGLLVFGVGAVISRLHVRLWAVPILTTWVAVFALLDHFPETLPQPVTGRAETTFWDTLGQNGVRCQVIGAPVAWPANDELTNVKLTTGLATPDALGSYHTYTLFTEPHHELAGRLTQMSGRIEGLEFNDDAAPATLAGPPARFDRARWKAWQRGDLTRLPRHEIPFTIERTATGARLVFAEGACEQTSIDIADGEWVRHVKVWFNLGGLSKFAARVSFKLLHGPQQMRLYATPPQFDPDDTPYQFRISWPVEFAAWLAREYGYFQTIGWAEATSALNDNVIDDGTFLETCRFSFDEKRAQILGLLDHSDDWDCLVAFTYEVDRVCHMMWRHMDTAHPAHDPTAPDAWRTAIRDYYELYDALLGEVMAKLPAHTVLMVCSDHGFAPFYRAVNLNRWLRDNGYLVLREDTGDREMGGLFTQKSEYYGPYDWSKSRAYALGLSKIYINMKGREPHGIVNPGAETEALKTEIIRKLMRVRDPERDNAHVFRSVKRREEIWSGPFVGDAGDLQIGFEWGYRVSWATSLGGADEPLIFDNTKNWSGDHCSFDPSVVPGVLFCNRPIDTTGPRLVDVGTTILGHFGAPLPTQRTKHDGRALTIR